ncbi:DUF6249 domain-containing protein [Algoriphagus sp. Y33]|uniref:DUF6249 domain-containing protein n=1 Tax=Algoriphagus sp. Y33 TaxID=2772483 RepID=UPI0017823CD6|nr:DUF6249 domain-containing protein [Algoriphagus sp. Y33]
METTTVTLFISLALVVFGICYYYFTHRHRERMFLLSKGLPPDYFKGQISYLPYLLVLAIVTLFLSIGIVVGGKLASASTIELKGSLLFLATLFFFLGLGLLTSYLILRFNRQKK